MLNEFDKKIILNILSDYDIKGVFSYKSYGFLQYCLFVKIEGFTLPLFNSYIVDVDKNNKDDLKTYCEKSKEQIASRVREFESHPPFDKSINPHELFKLTSFIFNIISRQREGLEESSLIERMPYDDKSFSAFFDKIYSLLESGKTGFETYDIIVRELEMDTEAILNGLTYLKPKEMIC